PEPAITRPPGSPEPERRLEIPGYDVLGLLGQGGMGIVYKVRDQRSGRVLALKMMQRNDPQERYLFKKEYRALLQLAHPHLVTIHEVGVQEQNVFFTMALLDGVTFLSYVSAGWDAAEARAEGGLGGAQVARLRHALRQLSAGLIFLHDSGVYHRDVK